MAEVIKVLSNGMILSKPEVGDKKVEYLPFDSISQGMYYCEKGELVRVKKARQTGNLYANRLNKETIKFDYERGLIYRLVKRMTLEEAEAFGQAYGFCCVCGLMLTNAKSVKLGIGPICRGYF